VIREIDGHCGAVLFATGLLGKLPPSVCARVVVTMAGHGFYFKEF